MLSRSESTDPGFSGDSDRAWWVVLGAALCMFCGQPAVAMYTFGVFVPEIVADTGWSASTIAAAIGPAALLASLMAPGIGLMADRVGVRKIGLLGGPAFGLGFVLLGLLSASAATFVILLLLMWALGFAGSPVPYAQLLTGWFDKRRGMAISLMFGAGALGIAVWPPLAAKLIAILGWRMAYAVLGVTAGAIILLASIFLLRDAPRANRAGAGQMMPGLVVSEAIRTARFWKIGVIFGLLTAILAGTAVNFPIILRQRGIDSQSAAAIMSVVGIAMLLGRISLGFVLDRWFSAHITAVITILPISALLILLFDASTAGTMVAAALLGFSLGSEFNAAAYMVSRAFGLRAFGAIYGLITLLYGIGGAIGPAVIGASLVLGMSFAWLVAAAVAILVLAILLLLTLKRSDLSYGTHVE